MGPCKLFDTAGLDELGRLGAKKRAKTQKIMEFCDVVVHVVDPNVQFDHSVEFPPSSQYGKVPLSELMTDCLWAAGCDGEIEARAKRLKKPVVKILNDRKLQGFGITVMKKEPKYVEIRTNLTKSDPHELARIIKQISASKRVQKNDFLPQMLTKASEPKHILLVIPLDA